MKHIFARNKGIVSVSRLKKMQMCWRSYYLKYVLGLPEEEKFYLTRGAIFHKVAEEFLLNPTKTIEHLNSRIDEEFKAAELDNKQTHDQRNPLSSVKSGVRSAISGLYDTYKSMDYKIIEYNDNVNPKKPSTELEFRVPFVDILDDMKPYHVDVDLYGFIDLISIDDQNGLSVRDHKLHSKAYNDFNVKSDIQLALYGYTFIYLFSMGCFPELSGQKLDHICVGFNSNLLSRDKKTAKFGFVNYPIDKERIAHHVREAINLIKISKMGVYPASPGDHCNFLCGYKDFCEAMYMGEDVVKMASELRPPNDIDIFSLEDELF